MKRGSVWLASAGIAINSCGRWLVVKKAYGGLKGQWSLPAGFVDAGETADEAAVREILEETSIKTTVCGIAAVRSGVIQHDISDTMILFHMNVEEEQEPVAKAGEIEEAAWIAADKLLQDPSTSVLLREVIALFQNKSLACRDIPDPGAQFGYTQYRFFI